MATNFNVDEFRTSLGNGGARPNQFQVTIVFPPAAPNTFASEKSSFLVTAASLPGQVVPPATVLYRGRQVHMAGDRVFTPWTTTILNDTQFIVRNAIERWMNQMEDLEFKRGLTQPSQYLSDLGVAQLDRNGKILKSYVFKQAFPTDLSDVALSFDANDQISTFTCTWQYQYFSVADDNVARTIAGASVPSTARI
jgi:hypothetical protein